MAGMLHAVQHKGHFGMVSFYEYESITSSLSFAEHSLFWLSVRTILKRASSSWLSQMISNVVYMTRPYLTCWIVVKGVWNVFLPTKGIKWMSGV
jgi:hypothetical protein